MGGRGGSSHIGRGRSSLRSGTSHASYSSEQRIAQKLGIHLDIASFQQYNIKPIFVKQTLKSVKLVYSKFPIMTGFVKYIDANETDPLAYASAGGDGGLHLGLYGRKSKQMIERMWKQDIQSGHHPKGAKYNNIFVHEMGHQIESYLNGRDYAQPWSWGLSSSSIVEAAAKKLDPTITSLNDPKVHALASKISGYAVSTKNRKQYPWAVWETLAEAVQDVVDNGQNAVPFSKAIYDELKGRL